MRRFEARRWAPRSQEDYATHVPVLVGLGDAIIVRRVLELGSGEYSTGVFLDRSIFPEVETVDSVETDPAWYSRVTERFGRDGRLSLCLVAGDVAQHVSSYDLTRYDLIMVDDSDTLDARRASIQAVAEAVEPGPLVLVHDAEIEEYRRAAKALTRTIRFTTLTPQTLVGWRGRSSHEAPLRAVRRAIASAYPKPAPSDVAGWARMLRDSGAPGRGA
jgi:hypothetical protein